MNQQTPVIIFSVYRPASISGANLARHNNAVRVLESHGVAYTVGRGYYKGQAERCIMVVLYDKIAETVARYLADRYGQESMLYLDSDRLARLETPQGELIESLGKLVDVPALEAMREDNYTVIDGRYWITCGISDGYKRAQAKRTAFFELAKVAADIIRFNLQCTESNYTDTGDAWDLLHRAQDAIADVACYE